MFLIGGSDACEAWRIGDHPSVMSIDVYSHLRPGLDHDAFGRLLDLLRHQDEVGWLPRTAIDIVDLELMGFVVDLETGAIARYGDGHGVIFDPRYAVG